MLTADLGRVKHPFKLTMAKLWSFKDEKDTLRLMDIFKKKVDTPELPDSLSLQALSETWQISYESSSGRMRLLNRPQCQLVIMGKINHADVCPLLVKWLKRRAKLMLVPWLTSLSQSMGIAFHDVRVKGQKTCWGSCSSKGMINLNYKLLFLPREMTRYVLVHELCHIRHLNHSRDFWQLVAQFEPDYAQHRRRLRQGHQWLPHWSER